MLEWGNDKQLVSQIKKLHKERQTDLRQLHEEMYLDILWSVMGRQDKFLERFTRSLIDDKPEEWQQRLQSNVLFPIVRRTVAKLAKKPIWDVLPATAEQEDVNVAKIATHVLQSYWFYLKMPIKLIRYLFWLGSCGNAFWRLGWDVKGGDKIELSTEDRAALQNMGMKRIPKIIQTGNIFIEPTSPFSIYWEKGIELEDSDWVLNLKLRSPDYIKKRYGKEVDPSGQSKQDNFIFKFLGLFGAPSKTDKNVVFEYWTKEKFVVITNGEVVSKGKNPYEFLPFVHTKEVEIPGHEWGMSVIRQTRPNQAEYNKLRSRMLEHANLMANPKWLRPRGGNVVTQAFTDRPGEVIDYDYPFKPEQSIVRPLPAYVERQIQACKQDIADIASQHNVSSAKNEPGARSGRAVMALQDADDIMFAPVVQALDYGLTQVGYKLLTILAQKVTEERLLHITGEENLIAVRSFTGDQLIGPNKGRPSVDYFNVRISTFTSYPLSRIGLEDRINGLIERGVLHPIRDRRQILAALGSGDISDMFDESAHDRARAENENYRIEQGEEIEALPTENHEEHVVSHTRFINVNRDTLKNMKGLMEHLGQHREFLQKIQEQMMRMQSQAVAQPAAKGAA